MANNNNNNYFQNIFLLNDPLREKLNTLNNFNLIIYNKIAIPRINLDLNNPGKIQKLLYLSLTLKDTDICEFHNNKGNNFNFNIEIKENKMFFKNIINKSLDLKTFFDKKKEINMINSSNINNEIQDIFFKFKDIKEPMPPKNIISLFKNTNINDNFHGINNIILDNINSILNQKNTSHFLETKNFNGINDKTIFNINFNIYINNFPYSSNDKQKPYMTKPLFSISSESTNLKDGKLLLKRGRKGLNTNNKNRIHSASDDDNILRKIQVHFLSFIVNYINDVIKTFVNDRNPPLFKNLDYKIKKQVNHKFVEKLKSLKISQILQMAVSPKMKIHDETVNKKIYWKICNLCPFMYIFLQKSYQSLFNEYYYNKNKIFEVNEKIIHISPKTKTFNDLIEKYESEKDKLKYISNKYFLNSCIKEKNK